MGLKADFIALLKTGTVSQIKFKIGTIRVYGDGFKTIADRCIAKKHIQIVQSATWPPRLALYNRKLNCLVIGPGVPANNLLVHEATHMLNDWHKRRVNGIEDEVSAHVARAMYMLLARGWLRNRAMRNRIAAADRIIGQQCRALPKNNTCRVATVNAAAMVAIEFLEGRTPSTAMLNRVRAAVRRWPVYVATGIANPRNYDGIRHVNLPAAELAKIRGTLITS